VINYRLASAINPPASPSTSLRFHWSFELQLRLGSVLRLASAINPWPCQRTTSNFPGDCILRSLLQFNLRLASAAVPPVFPPDQLPILRRPFGLPAYLPTDLRLAPGIASSSLAFEPNRQLALSVVLSGFPFGPTSNFRRISNPPVLPSNQPPTHHRISRL